MFITIPLNRIYAIYYLASCSKGNMPSSDRQLESDINILNKSSYDEKSKNIKYTITGDSFEKKLQFTDDTLSGNQTNTKLENYNSCPITRYGNDNETRYKLIKRSDCLCIQYCEFSSFFSSENQSFLGRILIFVFVFNPEQQDHIGFFTSYIKKETYEAIEKLPNKEIQSRLLFPYLLKNMNNEVFKHEILEIKKLIDEHDLFEHTFQYHYVSQPVKNFQSSDINKCSDENIKQEIDNTANKVTQVPIKCDGKQKMSTSASYNTHNISEININQESCDFMDPRRVYIPSEPKCSEDEVANTILTEENKTYNQLPKSVALKKTGDKHTRKCLDFENPERQIKDKKTGTDGNGNLIRDKSLWKRIKEWFLAIAVKMRKVFKKTKETK